MDSVSKETRSKIMRSVRRENTSPEMRVRKVAHRLGLRYRIHRKDLPGSPDLVFTKRKVCIFINGCFWHRHSGCRLATTPKSNVPFWKEKFAKNLMRDRKAQVDLEHLGWKVFTIWQCETENEGTIEQVLKNFFSI